MAHVLYRNGFQDLAAMIIINAGEDYVKAACDKKPKYYYGDVNVEHERAYLLSDWCRFLAGGVDMDMVVQELDKKIERLKRDAKSKQGRTVEA